VRSENKRDKISGKNEKRRNTDARYFSDKGKVPQISWLEIKGGQEILRRVEGKGINQTGVGVWHD
jgi:hypothetical protein